MLSSTHPEKDDGHRTSFTILSSPSTFFPFTGMRVDTRLLKGNEDRKPEATLKPTPPADEKCEPVIVTAEQEKSPVVKTPNLIVNTEAPHVDYMKAIHVIDDYFDNFMFAEAVEIATMALKSLDDPSLLFKRANAYRYAFQLENAINDWKTLRKNTKADPEQLKKLGQYLQFEQNYILSKSMPLAEHLKHAKYRLLNRCKSVIYLTQGNKDQFIVRCDDEGYVPAIEFLFDRNDKALDEITYRGAIRASENAIDDDTLGTTIESIIDPEDKLSLNIEYSFYGDAALYQKLLNNLLYTKVVYPKFSTHDCYLLAVSYKHADKTTTPFIISSHRSHTEDYLPLDDDLDDDHLPVSQWLYVIYAMAAELQRIHALGIAHGNINASDILIKTSWGETPSVQVAYSRFHHAYLLTDAKVTLLSGEEVAPHVNQDVRAFSFVLNTIIHNWMTEKMEEDISQWASQGVDSPVEKCPSLDALLNLPSLAKQRNVLFPQVQTVPKAIDIPEEKEIVCETVPTF